MQKSNNSVFLTDTKEDKILYEKSKPYAELLFKEFKQKIAIENYHRGVRFWLWLSLLAESFRFVVLFLYNYYEGQSELTMTDRILLSLYWWIWALTVLALFLCWIVHKHPEKYTSLITFVGDLYMLLYLVRGVGLAIMEVESGVIGISLITALLIAGFTITQRPIIALSNMLITAASFIGTAVTMKLTAFKNPSIIFSLVAVALLSLILSCANYHSRYMAFLREKSISIAKDKVNALNIELEKKQQQIELQNEQLKILSQKDSLTGLRNRHCFVADGKALMEKNFAQNVFLTLAITDVDNFKHINDNYGHTVGDECLLKIGTILRSLEKENVHAYRFGGDEFIVLFDGKSRSDAFLLMNRFLKEISNAKIHNFDGMLSASVGIYSAIPKANQSIDSFIEKADRAMYDAKANGKNRIMTSYKNTVKESKIKDENKGAENHDETN